MGALVIVESPTKARRIESLLGDGYTVLSSIGHVRDLPTSATQVPKSITDPDVRRLGVDTENHFKAYYVVTDPAKVRPLKDALKHADELLLATDEDREGEAIASWSCSGRPCRCAAWCSTRSPRTPSATR